MGNSPGPVNSPHKGPVTQKMFPFDDVIMCCKRILTRFLANQCFSTRLDAQRHSLPELRAREIHFTLYSGSAHAHLKECIEKYIHIFPLFFQVTIFTTPMISRSFNIVRHSISWVYDESFVHKKIKVCCTQLTSAEQIISPGLYNGILPITAVS